MARVYESNVTIIKKVTKQDDGSFKTVLCVEPDDKGKWNKVNVTDLYTRLVELGIQEKCPIDLFTPDVDGDTVPVLLYTYKNSPYIGLLSASKTPKQSKTVRTALV